jgi:hypothetical protein
MMEKVKLTMEIRVKFDYRGHSTIDIYDLDEMSIGAFHVLMNDNLRAFRYIVDMVEDEKEDSLNKKNQ